jgi:hypothetical protein
MAYISTLAVRAIRNALKASFPNIKFSVRKDTHSVNVSLLKGNIDFSEILGDDKYLQVNQYWLEHVGDHKPMFEKIIDIIKNAPAYVGEPAWYDKSDAQVDYFCTAYYFHIEIGKWDKPYEKV